MDKIYPGQIVRHIRTQGRYVVTKFVLMKVGDGEWKEGVEYCSIDALNSPPSFVRERSFFLQRFEDSGVGIPLSKPA